jgi:hypothetical protein
MNYVLTQQKRRINEWRSHFASKSMSVIEQAVNLPNIFQTANPELFQPTAKLIPSAVHSRHDTFPTPPATIQGISPKTKQKSDK